MEIEERLKLIPQQQSKLEIVIHWARDDGVKFLFNSTISHIAYFISVVVLIILSGVVYYAPKSVVFHKTISGPIDHKKDGTAVPIPDTRFKFPLTPKMEERRR